ncbi:MAG: ABC transporter substrate-binding protein, partial [Gammaproteobacteria bacterium]
FPVSDQALNYRMLFAGRIDLIAMGSMTCLTDKIDCSKLRKVYPLTDISRGLYMAFSRGTREEWRDRVVRAFESLRADGTLEQLQAPLRQ